MVFRTSYRGLVIWFIAAGVLALLGLGIASSESDPSCGEFGYLRRDSFTCEASSGLRLAYFFGGNCLLAGLSLAWATYKNSRALSEARFVSFSRDVPAINNWEPPVVYRSRIAPEHPKKPATTNKVDYSAPEDSHSESTAIFGLETEGRALSVQQSESLRFGSVVPVSKEQIEDAVKTQASVFDVTQELLTGIALAGHLKVSTSTRRLSGFELAEYFITGAAVGRLLFGFHPKANYLLDEFQAEELESSFLAVREDSEYLNSMAYEPLEKFLGTLPAGVGQYLSEALAEEEVSELEAEFLTRMFASGIAYVGFQAPQLKQGQPRQL